jgi:tetratricopeptide (TPR) repeat protein
MSRLVFALALALLLAAGPARAQEEGEQDPNILTPRAIGELSLDDLFAKLPDNADTPTGQRIEREILRRFSKSGSATADLLLSWAVAAIEKEDYPQALDLLDQIVVLKPDFAEAWNRRATVYYMLDDYSAALADIRVTLKLQPRHFGALAGFGIMLQSMDRDDQAMQVFRRALKINPQLERVKESLERLEKEQAAREI